jgi:hypothetical protein
MSADASPQTPDPIERATKAAYDAAMSDACKWLGRPGYDPFGTDPRAADAWRLAVRAALAELREPSQTMAE